MLHRIIFILISLCISALNAFPINFSFEEEINWQSVQNITLSNGDIVQRLSFEGATYSGFEPLPYFSQNYLIHTSQAQLNIRIENEVYVAADSLEVILITDEFKPGTEISIESSIITSRKQPYANVYFSPLRWNEEKKIIEKLVSFKVVVELDEKALFAESYVDYADNSVLNKGDWFKIRVNKAGVYKLTYSQLQEMGFDVSVAVSKIALYGNGGGTLPEVNTDFRYDDLVENAIEIVGGSDGSFDAGDYILFYGDDPIKWKYNYAKQSFLHENNYYDDYTYYFVTHKTEGVGKRIVAISEQGVTPTIEVTDFEDYDFHEIDKLNLAGSGRLWLGEVFDFSQNLSQTFTFNFPNVVKEPGAKFFASLASRAYSTNRFEISINGLLLKTKTMPNTDDSGYEYGETGEAEFNFTPKDDILNVMLTFQRVSNSSTGFLDYIEINVKRQLEFVGNQMLFRKVFGWEIDEVVKYFISGQAGDLRIWDISNVTNVTEQTTSVTGGKTTFVSRTDTLRQFIAFNETEYYSPEFVEIVANQNLHAIKNIDYLIISHPDFLEEANRLADFHREDKSFRVFVTTPQLIYNEFSSGSQDITAIRDFVKMFYDRSDAGHEIQYLLMFGDASYDYKNYLPDNTNFVPCWEHETSLNIIHSIATDDYFGYLDDGEGGMDSKDRVDIGIGRFVVATIEEAKMAVDKSVAYCTNSQQNMGPWRNQITFVADDEDSNRHLHDAETLASIINNEQTVYNIDKIYLDAYPQISTPSGQRAPEVNNAINSKMEKGTLIFNYSGHGGELGLSHERIMEIPDIKSWNNFNKLPIFITATCEFSRYDDPKRISAGEEVFLNHNGGAIALFTTARATYASSNLALNKAIYENNLFEKVDGEYPRFGDVIRKSKKLGSDNDKKFVLLGDPAVRLAYPEHNAKTVKINSNIVVEDKYDTLRALSKVTVEGIITDYNGNKLSDYDGLLFPTVYDKKVEIETLATDNKSYPEKFYFWKSVLFNGKADISNGSFIFEFVMPRDIAYNFGQGRISYYFNNDNFDGNGYYENLIIGGFNEDAPEDNQGPSISLFLNDDSFINGETTDENPVLLAYVKDDSGINTTGNGIGHDILAVIDDNAVQTFVLNDYYEAEANRYNEGTINYPFFKLEDGQHTLSLRVWDIYNNSNTAYLDFVVVSSEELVISNLFNYPNPVFNQTKFVFDHNQSNKDIEVEIQVFDMSGRPVKTLNATVRSETYKSEPIEWNTTTDAGGEIGRGFYVYRLTATSESGQIKSETSKLIFLKN